MNYINCKEIYIIKDDYLGIVLDFYCKRKGKLIKNNIRKEAEKCKYFDKK